MRMKFKKSIVVGLVMLIIGPTVAVAQSKSPPAMPSLRAGDYVNGMVALGWPKVAGAESIEVRLGNSRRSDLVATLAGSAMSFTLSRQIAPGTSLQVFLQAKNRSGTTDSNTVTITPRVGFVKPLSDWPSQYGYIGFGANTTRGYHTAVDLARQAGTQVYAVADGTVHGYTKTSVSAFGGFNPDRPGGAIIITHRHPVSGTQFYAIYGHVDVMVSPGQQVRAGEQIGRVATFYNGSTRLDHLHFGIYTGSSFPSSGWGYVSTSDALRSWSEPIAFLSPLRP